MPKSQVVEKLKELLAKAENDEIDSFAFVSFKRPGGFSAEGANLTMQELATSILLLQRMALRGAEKVENTSNMQYSGDPDDQGSRKH